MRKQSSPQKSTQSFLDLKDTKKNCPICNAVDSWASPKTKVGIAPARCKVCGTDEYPGYLCSQCSGPLIPSEYEHTASAKTSTSITKLYPAYVCNKCNHTSMHVSFIDELDTFAASLPDGFKLLPEVGIYWPNYLEVFAQSLDFYEEDEPITHRSRGMRIRFGKQGQLFKRSLDYVTNYDSGDYGHDISTTLRISPGPPYTLAQRQTLHILLARLRQRLEGPLEFWTVHFDTSVMGNSEDTAKALLSTIERCPADKDRQILALANTTVNNIVPGKFVNSYRLLETVLERLIEEDIRNQRWQKDVEDTVFLTLARTQNSALKTKLRLRVEGLNPYPEPLLRQIWRILRPGHTFHKTEIFAEIAKFRNTNVHGATAKPNKLILPWEIPPFDLFVDSLLVLIALMLNPYTKD